MIQRYGDYVAIVHSPLSMTYVRMDYSTQERMNVLWWIRIHLHLIEKCVLHHHSPSLNLLVKLAQSYIWSNYLLLLLCDVV